MTLTLDQLFVAKSPEEIFASLLANYTANGFPVTSWQPFGTERTRLMAIATVLSDISSKYVPQIAAGGFLDAAAALPLPDLLQTLSAQNYNLPFNPATFTVGNIQLTLAAGAGPYTIHDGDLTAVFAATGNRYICGGNGNKTLSSGTTPLTLAFAAEFAGAKYNDGSDVGSSLLTLVTSLPGVTLNNPSTTFTTVSHVGSGTGTIAPSGAPGISHQIVIQINTTGTATTCSWSYSINGGPFSVPTVGAAQSIGATGITATLTNGGAGTSFVLNDEYLFSNPGSWLTAQGSDDETAANLAQRCHDRWSSLSPIPVNNFWDLLVRSTPTIGSQVIQTIIQNDSVINNKIHICVAGPAGALPGAAITAIQNYVNPRIPGTYIAVVENPSTQAITLEATVTMLASAQAAATTAINVALQDYVAGIPINGTLRVNAIVDLIMNVAGVIDVTYGTAKINGSAANLTLGSPTTFVVPATGPTITITPITV